MKIYPFNGKTARIGKNCMIADSVILIGEVVIGDNCSIWPNVVIRQDTTPIIIGNDVHIEENSVLHTATHIEDHVMIGHSCTIEAFIGTHTMIGNTASLMPMAKIGANCAVAAGSVVTEFTEIPDWSFVVGSPGKVHSAIDPANPKHAMRMCENYLKGERGMRTLAQKYIDQGIWEHRDA